MSSSSYSSSEDEQDSPRSSPTPQRKDIQPPSNAFKNDGSFLEMFKKMQEQQESSKQADSSSESKRSSSNDKEDSKNKKLSKFVGKRRLGRVLPTGLVKKPKKEDLMKDSNDPKDSKSEKKNDPWSNYMAEVKRYKQQSCSEEEGSRRPLVK